MFVTFLCLVLSITSSLAASVPTGQTVQVGGIPYFVPAFRSAQLPASAIKTFRSLFDQDAELVPLTVVTTTLSGSSTLDLRTTLDGYKASDDVYTTGFARGRVSRDIVIP